jgi:hypothetical protein
MKNVFPPLPHVKAVLDLIKRHGQFTLRGDVLSFRYSRFKERGVLQEVSRRVKVDTEFPLPPEDPLFHKICTLKAGYEQIERAMAEEGIVDTDLGGKVQYPLETGTPCVYRPTDFDVAVRAIDFMRRLGKENRKLVELGGGLGQVSFLARLFGFDVTSYELSEDLYEGARLMAGYFPDLPELGGVNLVHGDFLSASLRPFGFVYMYLWDDVLISDPHLREKLSDELMPGAVVVVYEQGRQELSDSKFGLFNRFDYQARRTMFYEIK